MIPIDGDCAVKQHVLMKCEMTGAVFKIWIDCSSNGPGHCVQCLLSFQYPIIAKVIVRSMSPIVRCTLSTTPLLLGFLTVVGTGCTP